MNEKHTALVARLRVTFGMSPACDEAIDAIIALAGEVERYETGFLGNPPKYVMWHEFESMRAEVAALRKDAERYRWLRECGQDRSDRGAVAINWPHFRNGKLIDASRCFSHEFLDAAIDAALADKPT